MVHMGDTVDQSDEAMDAAPKHSCLELLTEGDIVTHTFTGARGGLIGDNRGLLREALDARRRGVKFDIGVGGRNFSFDAAKRVLDGGLIPDTISSDVTLTSRYAGTAFSQMDSIGKVMSLGIGLEDALVMATRNPAAVLTSSLPPLGGGSAEGDGGFERMLGCMAPGTHADLTILRVHEGEWEFIDGARKYKHRQICAGAGILHSRRSSHAHRLRTQRRRLAPKSIIRLSPLPFGSFG